MRYQARRDAAVGMSESGGWSEVCKEGENKVVSEMPGCQDARMPGLGEASEGSGDRVHFARGRAQLAHASRGLSRVADALRSAPLARRDGRQNAMLIIKVSQIVPPRCRTGHSRHRATEGSPGMAVQGEGAWAGSGRGCANGAWRD